MAQPAIFSRHQGPESAEAFSVTTVGPIVWASRTMLQAAGRQFNQWTLTSGGQVSLNGHVDPVTTLDTELVYHNHTLFQGTSRPDWYYWNTTTSDGTPGVAGWVFFNLFGPITLSGLSYSQNAVAGTVLASISVPMSANAAGDTFGGVFGGTLTLGGADAASFSISGANLVVAAGHTLTNTSYNITLTAQVHVGSFNLGNQLGPTAFQLSAQAESQAGTDVATTTASINASPTAGSVGSGNIITITSGAQVAVNGQTATGTSAVVELYYIDHSAFQFNGTNWFGPITSITSTGSTVLTTPKPTISLSNNSFTGGSPTGTVVGTISVTTGLPNGTIGAGAYTWALSLSGTGAGSFQIVGNTLETNGVVAAGSYTINIIATNATVIGSPFTLSNVTVTGASASNVARVVALRSTLGVNTGVSDYKAPYVTNNAADTVTALQFMGVTHIRDRMPGDGGFALANFWPKFPAAGIQVDLQLTTTATNVLNVANLIAAAKTMVALGSGFVETLEHPNEPFSVAYTYNGVTNPTGTNSTSPGFENIADFCAAMMTALAADSQLGPSGLNLRVLAGSLLMQNTFIDTGLEFLTVQRTGCYKANGTVLASAVNLHIYPKYGNVTLQSIDATHDNLQQWLVNSFGNPTSPGNFVGYSTAQLVPLPKYISEWGNNTATPAVGSNNRVTPIIQGKNNLTAWLNAFVEGYTRILLFELFDNPGATGIDEQSYGQFDSSHVAKLSATYFHNFNTVVNDTGGTAGTFTPTPINVTFTGMPSTGTSTVLQASNGTYFVIIWNNINNWNFSTATALTIAPTSVTVNFPSSRTLNAFDPTISSTSQQTVTGTAITVSLRDYPLIITAA